MQPFSFWVFCFLAQNLANFVHILDNSTTHFTPMKKKRSPLLAPEKMKAKKTNLKTIWKLMIMQHSLMKRRPDWGTVFEYLPITCWFSSTKHVHDRALKGTFIKNVRFFGDFWRYLPTYILYTVANVSPFFWNSRYVLCTIYYLPMFYVRFSLTYLPTQKSDILYGRSLNGVHSFKFTSF